MRIGKPQKRFRNFVFDSSIPGGIRFLLAVNMTLAAYFFIVSAPLSLLIYFNPGTAALGHLVIAGYGWVVLLSLILGIYPLWSARFAPRFWSILNGILLIGYGGTLIYNEISFIPVGFIFLILGSLSALFIVTGNGPRNYYRKDAVADQ